MMKIAYYPVWLCLLGIFAGEVFSPFPLLAGEPMEKKPVGIWEGILEQANLKVVFIITENTDHTLTATQDSPDQNAFGIPVETVTFENGHLHMDVPAVNGTYDGQINENGTEIDGKWTQGRLLTLNLFKTNGTPMQETPNPKFQAMVNKSKANDELEPKKPYPYRDEEIFFPGPQEGITLAGTLTLPQGAGPFPAVILIAGSGPHNRDETVMGHHIFLVISDYLTRRGIATLRYDKRGIGSSTGDYDKATSEDFAADALAGVVYLKGRKEINGQKIGLIGHSEGGLIAPMVAVKSPDISFIILMAGPGLNGEKVLNSQSVLALKAAGKNDSYIAINQKAQKEMFQELRLGEDRTTTLKKIHQIGAATAHQLAKGDNKTEETMLIALKTQEKFMLSPWLRFFIDYNPQSALEKVQCPVLALNGEKDVQVVPEENLPAIEKALKKGGNQDYLVQEWKGVNHLFQDCKSGGFSEYADVTPTPASSVLEFITDWIAKHTK